MVLPTGCSGRILRCRSALRRIVLVRTTNVSVAAAISVRMATPLEMDAHPETMKTARPFPTTQIVAIHNRGIERQTQHYMRFITCVFGSVTETLHAFLEHQCAALLRNYQAFPSGILAPTDRRA